MIFILFGKPDDIQRTVQCNQIMSMRLGIIFFIGEEFAFVDDYGFGDYRLRSLLYIKL
ncbi:MAG: hypothetical protein Ct9H90mP15_02940 [Candidatus Neomarinimicrobiota bacterium]|nr:MAG: hypothetical protein Ct9H90mP15_02940 [Candidatus Neomarinimicrobiota bacterium]